MQSTMNHEQQYQQDDKRNKVIITLYEEPAIPNQPRAAVRRENKGSRPPLSRSHGYDRKALLLAYSQQLRRLNAQQCQGCTEIARPDWNQWKAAFRDHSMKKGSWWKLRTWICRILISIRRRQWDFHRIDGSDDDEVNLKQRLACWWNRHCFCNHVSMHNGRLSARMRLKHVLSRISCVWNCGKR